MLQRTLIPIEDDTEDAPWMVMGSPQSDAAARLYTILQTELRTRGSSLYIATFLPIRYSPAPGEDVRVLSPDIPVARVPDHPRSSYAIEAEVTAYALWWGDLQHEAWRHALGLKPEWYAHMGVQEYAIFAPETPDGRQLMYPPLQGLRLTSRGDDYG